jgi:hypothetical protein
LIKGGAHGLLIQIKSFIVFKTFEKSNSSSVIAKNSKFKSIKAFESGESILQLTRRTVVHLTTLRTLNGSYYSAMKYRRDYTLGATNFFTVVAIRRAPLFDQPEVIGWLRKAFREEMVRRPFTIDAIAVMPYYIHAIWTLPIIRCVGET